jgi:hypothetical protein
LRDIFSISISGGILLLVTMFKWSVGLEKDDIYTSIKIAACVCGKDGLISFPEEEKIFQLVSEKSPSFTRVQFDQVIDNFFDSVDQIEDYAEIISDPSIRQFTCIAMITVKPPTPVKHVNIDFIIVQCTFQPLPTQHPLSIRFSHHYCASLENTGYNYL